jgi:iron complex transport system substrate-binding protein
MDHSPHYFQRIACLTVETAETLYLLGEQDRIVGISGYTTRPARARREKPKIAAFTSAKIEKILALSPDLVLTCTDLQADIAAALIKAGVEVHAFNQRSLTGIQQMITTLGALTGAGDKAAQLVKQLRQTLDAVAETAAYLPVRPKVYFEEWDEPLISGIGWVAELIEIAGGVDCFAELASRPHARDRIIADSDEVVRRMPDIIIGSWCGKKFQPEAVINRPEWQDIPAVRNGMLFEIKSADILQPGPYAITHGLRQLQQIVQRWGAQQSFAKHWS